MQTAIVVAIALAVVAFIVWPMLDRKRGARAGAVDLDRIEQRIQAYRDALRRRTVCESCLYANAEGSRFCAECGSRLPAAAEKPARSGANAVERP